MEKLDKSETVRAATDMKLIDLQKEMAVVKGENVKISSNRDKLSVEVKEAKKKLKDKEDELRKSQVMERRYLGVLKDMKEKVGSVLEAEKEEVETNGMREESEEGKSTE